MEKDITNSIMLSIAIAITITLAFFTLYQILYKYFSNRSKEKVTDKFFRFLDKKFEMDMVKEYSDIIYLRNSFLREDLDIYNIVTLLEDYLKYLTSIEVSETNTQEKIKNRYNFIKTIIEEENKEKPYANIPEEERRLLRSLKDSVDHNDKTAIVFNLDELSTLIATRNKSYIKTQNINRWSLPLSIIGLITTILLGIISLTQSVDYDKITKGVVHSLKSDSTLYKQTANPRLSPTASSNRSK